MIKIKNDFDLVSSLLSGQCFRFIKEENESYTCILDDRVVNIIVNNDYYVISSSSEENLEEKVKYYFDYCTNYDKYVSLLSNKDDYMKKVAKECKGYKIFNQDKFETYISYIISQNNNVKRISNSINELSKMCGKKVFFNNKEYYLFPTYQELSKLNIDDFRKCGVGFRDKYIINALEKIKDNPSFLEEIEKLNTEDALKELMSVKGIGLKVASCILIFGYHRFDVFPIDTWVIQNISENYKDIKPNQKSISLFAKEKYGDLSGLAIQYMYHYQRNIK